MTVRELIEELERLSATVPNGGKVEVSIMIWGKSRYESRHIEKLECYDDAPQEPAIVVWHQ